MVRRPSRFGPLFETSCTSLPVSFIVLSCCKTLSVLLISNVKHSYTGTMNHVWSKLLRNGPRIVSKPYANVIRESVSKSYSIFANIWRIIHCFLFFFADSERSQQRYWFYNDVCLLFLCTRFQVAEPKVSRNTSIESKWCIVGTFGKWFVDF